MKANHTNRKTMKKYIASILSLSLLAFAWSACNKGLPLDEDDLIITNRAECAVSNFELLGTDYVTVRNKAVVIDTTTQTIDVEVQFGTDLKNLYPQFTLAPDCKLDPKIVGRTDFSNLASPKVWTVISGNRQVRKPYTVRITVAPR
jgi:hypothetical protein